MEAANTINITNETLKLLNQFQKKFQEISLGENLSHDDIIKLLLNSFIKSLDEE